MDQLKNQPSENRENEKSNEKHRKEPTDYGPDYKHVENVLERRNDIPPKVKRYVSSFFRVINAKLDLLYTGSEADKKYVSEDTRRALEQFYGDIVKEKGIIGEDGRRFNNEHILSTLGENEDLLERLTDWAIHNEAKSTLSGHKYDVTRAIARALINSDPENIEVMKEKIHIAQSAVHNSLTNAEEREKLVDEKLHHLSESGFEVRRIEVRDAIIKDLSEQLRSYEEMLKLIESQE